MENSSSAGSMPGATSSWSDLLGPELLVKSSKG